MSNWYDNLWLSADVLWRYVHRWMNECMNEGRLNYRLISMCVCIYVSLLHDSASGGARTALAPCLETWLAPWLAPRYGSRQPTLYLLAMILLLLLVGSLHSPLLKRRDNPSEVQRRASKITMVMIMHHGVYIAYTALYSNAISTVTVV